METQTDFFSNTNQVDKVYRGSRYQWRSGLSVSVEIICSRARISLRKVFSMFKPYIAQFFSIYFLSPDSASEMIIIVAMPSLANNLLNIFELGLAQMFLFAFLF